jgi:hypothetical protein
MTAARKRIGSAGRWKITRVETNFWGIVLAADAKLGTGPGTTAG